MTVMRDPRMTPDIENYEPRLDQHRDHGNRNTEAVIAMISAACLF